MPAGLQVLDAAGRVVVDITTRSTRFVGQVSAQTHQTSWTFVSVPGMANDGTWSVISLANMVASYVASGGFYAREAGPATGGNANYLTRNFLIFRV